MEPKSNIASIQVPRRRVGIIIIASLLIGLVSSVITHTVQNRQNVELSLLSRNYFADVYLAMFGHYFMVSADCSTRKAGLPKPSVESKGLMTEVGFYASDRDAANVFVTQRLAGCRYMLHDSSGL